MPATVIDIRTRHREPTRADDERLLAAMREAETLGLYVVESEEEAVRQATDFVSPYLLQPLRSEQEARAQLGRPAAVRPHSVFAAVLNWWRGGTQ